MSRAKRHPASFHNLEVGEKVELYAKGENPNQQPAPQSHFDGWVRVIDNPPGGSRPQTIGVAVPVDHGEILEFSEDEFSAFGVEGLR